MKTPAAMTPIQIASNVIEKLQEENRISLETLHKTQSNIRLLERQLFEKEQLIKILEDRLRAGSNSFLEMSNKQKEITIKHLELQIQKLLKENQDLEYQINTVQSDICARCETRQYLGLEDRKPVAKSSRKTAAKSPTVVKQTSQSEKENREKRQERIIEHKDKRILHLSKEIQRLSHAEKELTNKIYRLTKLLPLSNMPSEVLTECLLKEIQSLENQLQMYKEKYDKFHHAEDNRFKKYDNLQAEGRYSKEKMSITGNSIFPSTSYSSMKLKDKFNSNSKNDNIVSDRENVRKENVALTSSLHKMYNDVSQLKRLFATENEKLHQSLVRDSLRNDVLSVEWKDIISRLNDIADSIKNIIRISPYRENEPTSSFNNEDVILRLQDRLKESLESTTRYENEKLALKENVEKLSDQLSSEQEKCRFFEKQLEKAIDEKHTSETTQNVDNDEVQTLRRLLDIKQKQLDSAESHLSTCKNLIEELKAPKVSSELKQSSSNESEVELNSANSKKELKSLQIKLTVAEKNIKACEDVIEGLQGVIQDLDDKNVQLDSELSMIKYKTVLSEAENNRLASLNVKLKDTKEELTAMESAKKDFEHKCKSLEEESLALQDELRSANLKLTSLQSSDNEKKSLISRLEDAEKHISNRENEISQTQNTVEKLRNENARLQARALALENEKAMSTVYEDDVMALRTDLILKEDEIRNLKESLQAFERKAFEMNHYRKTLRQEIEKLCNVLLEKTDDKSSANRKAIYKAAVLHSAQSLLRLDENYNVQSEDSEKESALGEMKHQVSVYLTEVARIHELLTIKEQERVELLRQYLDLNDQFVLPSVVSSHEVIICEDTSASGGRSLPVINLPPSSKSSALSSSPESGIHSSDKTVQTERVISRHSPLNYSFSEAAFQSAQEELNASKTTTNYFLRKCSELEDLLAKEQGQHAQCQRNVETYEETIKDLRSQLNAKDSVFKRLNTIIEMMRSKECNDEITMEQLKSEIKWLMDENQKVFERIMATQSELSKCKEENSRVQNDLETLKRQLVNEKYENAKVNGELKHLRVQLTNSQSSIMNV